LFLIALVHGFGYAIGGHADWAKNKLDGGMGCGLTRSYPINRVLSCAIWW